jgi:2-dehydro-3-deoxy-D-arabinonate dehydratase
VSEDARQRESQSADIYARVYDAERPEVFFKASGARVRGPGQTVGLRPDSRWQVPEPELALVIGAGGRIVGYTCGNDMSCRDIEGANPLYLPQAKIYDGACALGPAVLLADGPDEARRHGTFAIRLRIERAGALTFAGESDTARMVRSFQALVACLGRAYSVLPGTVLLTGAGVVPPDDFSLAEGDRVTIAIDGIGELTNACATVTAAGLA